MGELERDDIYACAISMPRPEDPVCTEWIEEISRHVDRNQEEEIYLIGHSLGGPAILRYLESSQAKNIHGVILVSAPSERNQNKKLDTFLDREFDFQRILLCCKNFSVVHGDNDPLVPVNNAEFLSEKLGGNLVIIKN